jgi:hypothetical protein
MLPIVVVLAANPNPPPSASPPPTKLHVIGTVRAAPICTTIVVHANGAITQALDNDRTLAIVSVDLRTVDFDRQNSLQRRNVIDAMLKQTQVLRQSFHVADGEIKTLRRYAVASNDPQRKAELKAFADALGGALQRQERAAEEFDRNVTILRGREEAEEARAIERRDVRLGTAGMIPQRVLDRMDVQRSVVEPPRAPRDGEWNRTMQQIADVLDDRTHAIALDEGTAADHSIAATTGC